MATRTAHGAADPLLRGIIGAVYEYLVQGGSYALSFEEAERRRTQQYCDAEAAAKIFARACVAGGLGDPVML